MAVRVIYREVSEQARDVTTFLHDFRRRTGVDLDTLDPDTREGADICRLYDIVQYPAIIATDKTTGVLLKSWQGLPLPTIDEVSYYERAE